jgi:FtsP/CotA-like multicopper oxidase with cupredoxin domain
MSATNMQITNWKWRLLLAPIAVFSLTVTAHAAAPGIKGVSAVNTFDLVATQAFITQPDGAAVYSWGYGCATQPGAGMFAPAAITTGFCNTMQIPGPTMVVTQGQSIIVNLTNNLPASAGNTSILFPGFTVTATEATTQPSSGCAGHALAQGLLTSEATHGCTVTYTFTATNAGTHSYYSGTQSDLQIEMGLFGAIVVTPSTIPTNCTSGIHSQNESAQLHWSESDFRLAKAAYNHPEACYDREYLFQFSEMDPSIHRQAEEQVNANLPSLNVATEPYHPAYFMINGRSMPDDMDPNYASEYQHQPYNGDPHLHPGELVLIRVIGQGRWQHPFHQHANHVRVLARDGNLILTADKQALAGPALFTTSTVSGQTVDSIFYFTGRGLNWDMYGHNPKSSDPNAILTCNPDANGYNTLGTSYNAINYFEWCADHNKPLQVAPFGDVAGNGPVSLPDPNILTNGPWFGGSPYLGADATTRATFGSCASASCGTTGTTPPSGTVANNPSTEAAFAFMWHSHNERELTTNNIFPGGMFMMMLVDSREYQIDETN